jgi:hypothetical protein
MRMKTNSSADHPLLLSTAEIEIGTEMVATLIIDESSKGWYALILSLNASYDDDDDDNDHGNDDGNDDDVDHDADHVGSI